MADDDPGKVAEKAAAKPSIVVFDLGGVLIDYDPRHLYRKLFDDPAAMERFLASVTTTAWHVRQDHGGDPAAATRELVERHPDQAALIEAYYGRFAEMLDHAFPEMAALVERLHRAGTPLFLLSNAPAFLDAWARGPGRQRHPFLACFRDVVVSGHVGHSKPDAGIYNLICWKGGFAPAQAVFIDDNLPNVEGARAAGLQAIHHRTAAATIAALRRFGLPA